MNTAQPVITLRDILPGLLGSDSISIQQSERVEAVLGLEVNHIQSRASWHACRTWGDGTDRDWINQRKVDYKLCREMWDCAFWAKPPPATQRSTDKWGLKF